MSQDASELFTRLAPVLNIEGCLAERAFYQKLGLPVIYEGPEYPDFIGFGTETVHFGIQKAPANNDPPVLTWQIGVTDIDSAVQRCRWRESASNSNAMTPRLGGPPGGCSSAPQAATGWHSKAPANSSAAEQESPRCCTSGRRVRMPKIAVGIYPDEVRRYLRDPQFEAGTDDRRALGLGIQMMCRPPRQHCPPLACVQIDLVGL